ncbi:MAG: long-chain fatty acid--CoA ligase [Bacteroidetes bacterium]|nr:MAG: long-chain fatty acid--CoA ligase [Bacteroidota bacterium]
MEAKSLPHLFELSTEKFGDNTFMWEKKDTHYKGFTYQQTLERVRKYASGLLHAGLQKGDRVALISEGRNDWVVSELAILYCGGICVPLSVKIDEDSDLIFRLKHSGCKALIISGNHMHKAYRIADELPDLKFMVLLDGKEYSNGKEPLDWLQLKLQYENILDLDQLLKNGEEFHEEEPEKLDFILENLQPDDFANICYTSGTTADPKGIILTHKNYLHNMVQASSLFEVPEYYTSLHILPWDHSFAHTVGIYTLMLNGASLASVKVGKTLNETLRNIPINIKEVRPYFLLSVPALAKNFRNNIEKGVREKGKIAGWLFNTGLKLGYSYNQLGYNRGKGLRILIKPLYKLFNKILFSKIQENFGGRLKFFVGGGALLDLELQKFFYTIGLPMYQGYGLTEAAPVISSNTPDNHKLGSSGKIVPFMELKIVDEEGNEVPTGTKGEIIVKGDNVMAGYWENEQATKETIRDGWLYTGDLGYLDEDGYLYVLGRFKSLLIGSDGEKYSPEGIEEAMVEKSAYIDQVMLFNNQNAYTSALIFPNKSSLLQWADKNNFDIHSEDGQKALLLKIQAEINRFMPGGDMDKMFPSRWLPAASVVLNEPFSEKNRMINSTMKMVRPAITEAYKKDIDFLYTPEGKDICNSRNLENLEKLFSKEPE